jgi:hypothetical protein
MNLKTLTFALPLLLATTVQAQLVHTSVVGPPWKAAFQHLSTGVVTPTGTTLTGLRHAAADEASGVLYLVRSNGSNLELYSWAYGAPDATLVGDIFINGSPIGSSNSWDMAFAADKLYLTYFGGFNANRIYEIDPATATGTLWLQPPNGSIHPNGICYDPQGDRFIVSSGYTCNVTLCTLPAGMYAIDRSTQSSSLVATLPTMAGSGSTALALGGGHVWAIGLGSTMISKLDLATLSWDPTPATAPAAGFFTPGMEWAPGFTSGCAGVTYCTAGTSSAGCVASICAAGTPSGSSGSGFTLSISGVDGQRAGLILYGVSGPIAAPWSASSTSYRCVQNPVQRMGAQNSGGTAGACDGAYSEDWNAYLASHPGALGQPFGGGEVVWAQAWYRDPPASKSSSLSNGIEFYVQP